MDNFNTYCKNKRDASEYGKYLITSKPRLIRIAKVQRNYDDRFDLFTDHKLITDNYEQSPFKQIINHFGWNSNRSPITIWTRLLVEAQHQFYNSNEDREDFTKIILSINQFASEALEKANIDLEDFIDSDKGLEFFPSDHDNQYEKLNTGLIQQAGRSKKIRILNNLGNTRHELHNQDITINNSLNLATLGDIQQIAKNLDNQYKSWLDLSRFESERTAIQDKLTPAPIPYDGGFL